MALASSSEEWNQPRCWSWPSRYRSASGLWSGRGVLSPAVMTRLVRAVHGADGAAHGARAPVALSPREREILAAVSRGRSNSQIGTELFIAEATVKTYLLRAFHKLGVDTRAAAVAEALRRGLLDLG